MKTIVKKRKAKTTYLSWQETGFFQDVTVQRVNVEELPQGVDVDDHTIFYEVKGVSNDQTICYLVKGCPAPYGDPKQISTIFRNGQIHYGCETTLLSAFKRATKVAIHYTF